MPPSKKVHRIILLVVSFFVVIFAVQIFFSLIQTLSQNLKSLQLLPELEEKLLEQKSELEIKREQILRLRLEQQDFETKETKKKESLLREQDRLSEINRNAQFEIQRLKDRLKDDKDTTRLLKNYFVKASPEYYKVTYDTNNLKTDENDLIFLSVIGHSESYGPNRNFEDFMKLLLNLNVDHKRSTLGLLFGVQEEFDKVVKFVESQDEIIFSKTVLIYAPFLERKSFFDRTQRHSDAVQKERRRTISRSRNFLISEALREETFTFFLDSDMISMPSDTVDIFRRSKKDIVVPRIAKGQFIENYDFNSWVGARVEPTSEEDLKLDSGDKDFVFIPRPNGAKHMHDLARESTDREYLAKLDSVGGAILWVKSEIFKQGVVFPPFYLIGAKWGRLEGYDGIETEGLCYQARTIGYDCWGMPNLVAYHIDEEVN